MKSLLVLSALLLSASPALADEYKYLECKGSLQWYHEDMRPSTNMMQRMEITLDEPNEKMIVSTELYPSTQWRWATFEKTQIKTYAKNDSAEELLVIDREAGNYTKSGYFGKGYAKVAHYKAEGNCQPK